MPAIHFASSGNAGRGIRLDGGASKEAWETLRPLEAAAADDPDYYKLLALAYARLDRLPEAITAGRHALRLAPKRQDLLLNLAGEVYQMARNNQAAIKLLQDALRDGTASPQIYFALALSQFNFGSYEDAVRSCDKALTIDPKFDRAALLKGTEFRKTVQAA